MFEPTAQDRLAVTTLSACGTRHALIARHLQIDEKTLKKHFRKELSRGREDANAMVARSLFSAAVGGNITAAIFWLKTRAGWKETQINEFVGANGERLIPEMPDLGISFARGGPGRPRVEGSTPGSDVDGVFVTPPAEEIDAIPHEPRALSAPREPVEPKPKESAAALQWAALAADDETPK
jgi:hypothetical protein